MEKMAREILFMIGEHKGRTKEEIENFENEGEDAISSLQYSLNYISSTFANTTLLLDPKQYDLTTANTPLPNQSSSLSIPPLPVQTFLSLLQDHNNFGSVDYTCGQN